MAGLRVVAKIKKKGRKIDLMKKTLSSINNERADIGYFSSQGLHTTSGYTFPVLMAIHEFGIGYTPRPVFTLAAFTIKRDSQFITKYMKLWGASITSKGVAGNQTLLESIGINMQRRVAPIFGNPALLTVKSNPTPLIKTSELVSNLARRNTLDKTVRRL